LRQQAPNFGEPAAQAVVVGQANQKMERNRSVSRGCTLLTRPIDWYSQGKQMHHTKSLACLLLAGSISSAAFANDQLNLVGTWVGVANVAVLGVNPHHGTTNAEEVKFANTKFTFIIDKQEGRNFSGYRFSTNGHEDRFVGALRSDMKSGVMSDSDGTRVALRP
jgi:hypothetical protein